VQDHDQENVDEVAASVRALGEILEDNYDNGARSFIENEEIKRRIAKLNFAKIDFKRITPKGLENLIGFKLHDLKPR
jgi:hypothetical protein